MRRVGREGVGARGGLVDDAHHAVGAVAAERGLATVEPDGVGVVDGDAEDGGLYARRCSVSGGAQRGRSSAWDAV